MEGTVASFVVKSEDDRVKVKRKTLQAVLVQCQKALESLSDEDPCVDYEEGDGGQGSSSGCGDDKDADELCDLLRSRVDCLDFLEKLETARMSVSQHLVDEYSSWDMVSKNDLWDGDLENLDLDEYALVGQEDIVDGIACFMAAYLLSIKQTKDVTPNQLQDALSKTFAVKKKKGKLRKVWDGSKVVYNAASWGATAIGFYNKTAANKPSRVRWIGFTDFITGTGIEIRFEHISGKDNVLADALSRLTHYLCAGCLTDEEAEVTAVNT